MVSRAAAPGDRPQRLRVNPRTDTYSRWPRRLGGLVFLAGAAGLAWYYLEIPRPADDTLLPARIDTNDLGAGSYVETVRASARVFVIRDFDGALYVFGVPYWDGAYWLPEFDWSRPARPCAIFGPDNVDGRLVEGGMFRCREPEPGEFFRREHSWTYSGENQGYHTVDMKQADFRMEGTILVLPP